MACHCPMELLHKRPIDEVTIESEPFRLEDQYTSRHQGNLFAPTTCHQHIRQSQLDLQHNFCEVDVDSIALGNLNNFPFMNVVRVVGLKVGRCDYRHFLERSQRVTLLGYQGSSLWKFNQDFFAEEILSSHVSFHTLLVRLIGAFGK